MLLKIQKLHKDAVIPQYAHVDDSGMDLCSVEETTIPAGGQKLVKTGLGIELPPNTEAQVRPRSGLALKFKVGITNSPGTIDEGYRGEVAVIVENRGDKPFPVSKGTKIAQMVIAPVLRPEIEVVNALTDTTRCAGGFGSTGM